MARLIDSVIGHQEVWENLQRQIEQQRLAHALAFVGTAGIGKRKLAWALAQTLVCERTPAPCGECGPCRRVENQQTESVLLIEPTSGSIKLEAAQQVMSFLNLQRIGRARVILIDNAQLLNPQAGNSLLKIIEEPPPQTYFILLVSEFSQLLPTLRSRVQVVRFAPLSASQLQQVTEEPAPEWMLRSARGSSEQLAAFRDSHSEDLRVAAFEFLKESLNGRRVGLQSVLEQAKDRDSALGAIHFLQQLLRDWSVLETGETIHSDLSPQLAALPALSAESRVQLWRTAFQMELDMVAHVDKSLLFENFFYRAKSQLG